MVPPSSSTTKDTGISEINDSEVGNRRGNRIDTKMSYREY